MTFLRSSLPILGFGFLVACSGGTEAPVDVMESPYFSFDDKIIELEGQSIRYRETGPEEGQPVILLHGFTDSLHTWDEVVKDLDDDFRVLRPDLPGHGLSGPNPDGDYSNEALVGFVRAFLAQSDVKSPILVGNSLGGLAAWRFAAEQPETVKGIVLLAPGGVPHNGVTELPAEVPAMLRFYLKNAPKAGVQAAMEAMYGEPENLPEGRVTQYRDLMAGQGDAFVTRAAQFTLPDPTEDFARVEVPTIIIWGDQDRVLPADHADRFVAEMPQAELVLLEGVGHLPQAEAPDVVIDAIRRLSESMEPAP